MQEGLLVSSSIVLKNLILESSYSFCLQTDVINYDVFYELKPLNCRSYNTLALVHSVAFIFVASIAGPVFISLF
jgi:hypothetical protein